MHCRVPGCACPCFEYVYHRASGSVKCGCKHALDLHRGTDGTPHRDGCRHSSGCSCARFAPTVTCVCTAPASAHTTVFERRSERQRDGRVVGSLWEGLEDGGGVEDAVVAREHAAMSAAAGGLTSFLSLAPGVERVQIAASSALPRPQRMLAQTPASTPASTPTPVPIRAGAVAEVSAAGPAAAVQRTDSSDWCTAGGEKHDWKQWHRYVTHCRKYRCERNGCGFFKKCWTKCVNIDCTGCHVIGHKRF